MKITRALIAFVRCLALCLRRGYMYDYPNLLSPHNSSQWAFNGTGSGATGMFDSLEHYNRRSADLRRRHAPVPEQRLRSQNHADPNLLGRQLHHLPACHHRVDPRQRQSRHVLCDRSFQPDLLGRLLHCDVEYLQATKRIAQQSLQQSDPLPQRHGGALGRLVSQRPRRLHRQFFRNLLGWGDGSPITSGDPAVGVEGAPSGNGISTIDIGHQDTVAPNAINSKAIGISAYPNHVHFQFPGTADDAIGTGVAFYQWWRCTGTSCTVGWLDSTESPQFSDTTVQQATTYTYLIQAQDYHYNATSVSVTVTTPTSAFIRRGRRAFDRSGPTGAVPANNSTCDPVI